jgi:putative transposase
MDRCKRHNITERTFYRWRNKFGSTDVPEACRLKERESENDCLKRLITEQLLMIDSLKEFRRKNDDSDGPMLSAGSPDLKGTVATQGVALPGTES